MATTPITSPRLVNIYRLAPIAGAPGHFTRSAGCSGSLDEAVTIAQARPVAWPLIEAVDVRTGESWVIPTPVAS